MIAPDNVYTVDLLIAAGTGVSSSYDARGHILAGLILPAALTSTSMGIAFSEDGVNFVPVFPQSGGAVAITVGTSRFVSLSLTGIASLPGFIRLTCGSTEVADRVVKAVFRPLS